MKVKCVALSAASRKDSYSLVCFGVVLSSLWKAKHPAHNSAAVDTPTQVANLPPSPSVLHFHHTLCDQALLLGRHEDGTKADFLDFHLTVTLWGRCTSQSTVTCVFCE